MESLPSRERGLKFAEAMQDGLVSGVAPLAGAWIEMGEVEKNRRVVSVAPLAGAWIEIDIFLPSPSVVSRRSPRGSVD